MWPNPASAFPWHPSAREAAGSGAPEHEDAAATESHTSGSGGFGPTASCGEVVRVEGVIRAGVPLHYRRRCAKSQSVNAADA